MDSGMLQEMAESISRGIRLKKFPLDFWNGEPYGEHIEIPEGDTMMFRKDEFVQVMIGDKRFNFMDHYLAKFLYYCAKTGVTSTCVPDRDILPDILSRFEEYLDSTKKVASVEIKALSLDQENSEKLAELLFDILGISGLV
ncbi:MAG: F0F1 ATP synthase subunit delta [Candidatus Thermoplasmatota archaeon]|jgi:hypothetical protein|nr:F0F1 ATP synthase subunit delta [Candidatus Thermoplasmatota archaeon]